MTDLSAGLAGIVIGATGGYIAGTRTKHVNVDESAMISLREQVATLSQANQLLLSQVDSYKAMIEAMKDTSDPENHKYRDLIDQLNQQIAQLQAHASEQMRVQFSQFPIMLGPGDPTLAGWIKGRDGLLIHRHLSNFIPNGVSIAPVSGFYPDFVKTNINPSNVMMSSTPKTITIGASMNTSLGWTLPQGMCMSMATILNFAEDISKDDNFIARARSHSMLVRCMVVPVGSNSLMVIPLTTDWAVDKWNQDSQWSWIFSDMNVQGQAAAADVKQRVSYAGDWARSNFVLSHRTATQLNLQSISIIANPLLQYLHTSPHQGFNQRAQLEVSISGSLSVVKRRNSTTAPIFYSPTVDGGYEVVEVKATQYV